jgi:intein/homing endonuclease
MELSNGEILKLTPDHEVYTELRGWIPAKNIAEDDNILEF